MSRYLTASVFVFCMINALKSQVIEGLVLQEGTKTPIPYANILIPKAGLGTVSQFDGRFKIDVSNRPEGMDSLEFSALGFKKKGILITKDMDTVFVYLKATSMGLEPVLVSPKSPEELINMAIAKIPENYMDRPFNGTLYQRSTIRLNGRFMESTESIMKGYIMPAFGALKDSTRIKMLAFKYFDEEEEALGSVTTRKRKNKNDKLAIEGIDSAMINLSKGMSQEFDIYRQVDSNFIRQLYEHGAQIDKTKMWFDKLLLVKGREVLNIGFKGRLQGIANQRGQILLDYESLAMEAFSLQIRSSSLKIKALLTLMGIKFNGADVVIRTTSIPTENGWIPDLMSIDVFVDLEKIRIFSNNVPVRIEINTYTRFLDIEVPATDECKEGQLVKKGLPLQEQFKSDKKNPIWERYKEEIDKP